MKRVLVALVVLLLVLSPLAFCQEAEELGTVEITEEMMKEAIPADEDTILLEIVKEEEAAGYWEKYFYLDVDQDLNEDSQTLWTRVGLRRGSFDFSIGWSQKFNAPEPESMDKGTISLSLSYSW